MTNPWAPVAVPMFRWLQDSLSRSRGLRVPVALLESRA
jgi:hypothetical protein